MGDEVQGRVAGMRTPTTTSFWVDTDQGSQALLVPDDWQVKAGPLRLLDPLGTVRLQTGDLVRLSPSDPADPTLLELLERLDAPIRKAPMPLDQDGHGDGFFGNLIRAVRCWRLAPTLPLMALSFAALLAMTNTAIVFHDHCTEQNPCTPGVASGHLFVAFLNLMVLVAYLGFLGVQRVWYADLYAGGRPYPSWALGQLPRYIGRFLRLTPLFLIVLLPLGLALRDSSRSTQILGLCLATLPLDALLTFVTPALALTTPSVIKALRLGLGQLRRGWPSDLPYVLVPPLAATFIVQLDPGSTAVTSRALLLVIARMVGLAITGAVTFRYVQQTHPHAEATAQVQMTG